MSEQQQNTLKWGDIIRIHGVNLNKHEQSNSKGLIISKAFTDSNIYYQKYSEFDNVNFYRQSLFQIMPQSNFDIHDQLNDPKNLKSPERDSLKKKAEGQIQSLYNSLVMKKGENVLYGAQAIFRHVQSNSYLRGLLKAADTGDGAFTIQVSPQPSKQIIWKINTHRSYQHDGDPIFFDDELLIYHVSTDCFMNFADQNSSIYLDTPLKDQRNLSENDPGFDYVKCRPSIKKPNEKRTSIINQNKSKCLWKFIEHCRYESYISRERIKSHAIVYFQHTKNKGCISSSLNEERYFLKETKDQKPTFESFWELIPKVTNELGPENCNDFYARNIVTGKYLTYKDFTVQVTPKEQIEGGGFINKGLINLICSPPLSPGGQGKKIERGQIIPKNENVSPAVKFSQELYQSYDLKDVEELTEDSFLINQVDEQTIMNIQYILSSHEHLTKFLNGYISFFIKLKEKIKRDYEDFTEKIANAKALGKDNEVPGLQAERKKALLYDFTLSVEQLENIRNVLEMLAGKIYGTTYADIGPSGNTPHPTIQKILVQTGTTQLLIEIIYQLYDGFKFIEVNTDPSADRACRVRISQVFERVYRLLQKIVVGNTDNRFYLSRWVDLFLEHSKNINREYIQECLVGILQNNPKAIEATINPDKIKDLIKRFYEQAKKNRTGQLTTKYLRLFSTFIKCEDRILKQNQNVILQHFFKDKDNAYCYRFKIEAKDDEVQNPQDPFSKIKTKRVEIALDKQDFSPIPKYYKDWGPKWNYFLHFVNLLADVCMDKNNVAIQNVSALVSLQMVTIILFDSDIAKLNGQIREANEAAKEKGQTLYPIANVHEPFVRIAHYIYVYNNKFTPIKTIKNISRWYRHQGEEKGVIRKEDINTTKRPFQGEKEQEEKFYLTSILKYIEAFIESCNQDNADLNILHTVLLLFKETVLLGLWESISQFRKLIPLIIMRITKIDDKKLFHVFTDKKTPQEIVLANKEGLSFNRPQIALNINCKIKTTQIFKYINELEIDIRLRYMMNFFKGLYEATQNFDDYNKQQKEPEIKDTDQNGRNVVAREEFHKSEYDLLLGDVPKISEDQDIMLKVNIWCNKFKQLTPFEHNNVDDMSKNRYLFQGTGQKDTPSFDSMVLALLQLPVYKDNKLLSSSLRMLRYFFQQRKDLIEQFKGILVCGKGNLLEVYMTLKYMRDKFEILTNQNILDLKSFQDSDYEYFIKKPYDNMQKINKKRSGILQDLFFLSRTLKEDINLKNIELLMHVDDQIFKGDSVYNYLNQKERNNKLFQDMNIAQGIYQPLMTYIKIVGENPLTEIHRQILFGIYHYLALLCFNNLDGKQKLMQFVPNILPHLKHRVGAANFLYQVTVNNKNLIANTSLVEKIINGSLQACIQLDQKEGVFEGAAVNSYQKSQILFALKGILLLNAEGFRINQEILMNRFQDNKYKKLIFKGKVEFINKRDNFGLSYEESYISNFFELFSVIVESKNFINVGKLENIHPYPYCLESLKNTNRWQIRRAIRAYINRLYYVNKDRDIFLFEEFIRKEFKIINDQLDDLIILHRNKSINDEVVIPNGIRFKFALSEIIEMILQIFVTIEEMLLKPEFLKILKREIQKEEHKVENQRQIHDQLVRLLHHIGCLNKLYPNKNIISSFIKQIKKQIYKVLQWLDLKYLEKQARHDLEAAVAEEQDDLGLEPEKKNYIYDHSKSFFRNLSSMIRDIKAKEKKEELKRMAQKREKKEGSPQELKQIYIETIFACEGESLKPIISKKFRQVSTSLYKPHIQTANSRIFKVIAKPTLTENEENIQLNRRLNIVKEIIDESPVFRKLKEDEFYKLVSTLTLIDQTSKLYYEQRWISMGQNKPLAVVPLKQIFTKSFQLIMNNHETIDDQQKIFVIRIARCFITQAVEGNQNYKLSVDKWNSEYFPGEIDQEDPKAGQRNANMELTLKQLERRQELIMECGGSQFIESIFKYNNTFSNKLQILNETLLLGISYLFNGNTNCQNSMLQVLAKDPQNMMLLSIKRLISNIGLILIQIRKIKDQAVGKDRDFAYSIVDVYDFLDIKNNVIASEFGASGYDKASLRNEKGNQQALCRMFRFLQLFCENNNTKMKQFLLQQYNDVEFTQKKTNSINFIEVTTLLLRKLFKIMNTKVVGIPPTLLDFINQITQLPCINNQIAFMKSTFFEDLSYLADYFLNEQNLENRKFTLSSEGQSEQDPLCQLKAIYQKGVDLALCNFQGNDNILIQEYISKSQPKFLWIVIKQNLMKILKDRAQALEVNTEQFSGRALEKQLLSKFNSAAMEKYMEEIESEGPMLNDQIQNILSVIYILKKIQVYEDSCREIAEYDKNRPNLQERKKANKAAAFKEEFINFAKNPDYDNYQQIENFLKFFENLILSIEISCFNGKQKGFQFIYFPKHPIFNYLAADTKDSIMMRVKRQTQRDKLITLLSYQDEVYEQINLNYTLKYVPKKLPFIKDEIDFQITSEYAASIRKMARNISFFICFLMLFFIMVDHDTQQMISTFTYTSNFSEFLIRVAASLQMLVTLWFMVLWISLRKPLALNKYDLEVRESQRLQASQAKLPQDTKKKEYKDIEGWQLLVAYSQTVYDTVRPYFSKIKSVFMNIPIIRNTFVTAYALSQYESGFLSILMFVIATIMGNFVGVQWYTIHLFDIFTDISQLTNIFKAILNNFKKLAFLSSLAAVFILVFNVISLNTYTPVLWQQDLPEEACEDIVGCVLTLYTGGAIGESMEKFQNDRFVFDTVYFVFMEIMFNSIIGGIMIDAFGELKQQDSARDEDKQTFCYICNMKKAEMQRTGSTFDKHIAKHFLWNYLYYLYILKKKGKTDYTGLEFDIDDKVSKEDVDWFPAMGQGDTQGQVQNVLNQLTDSLNQMFAIVDGSVQKSKLTHTDALKVKQKLLQKKQA